MRKSCCETALFSLYTIRELSAVNWLWYRCFAAMTLLPEFFIAKKCLHLSPFGQSHRLTIEMSQKTNDC